MHVAVHPVYGAPRPRLIARARGMGQGTSITESLLNFLQDAMAQIQAGGIFPIQGPGNDMSRFTVAQVLTWSAGQYCNAHADIEPACANIPALVAQVAGPYANRPAVPSALTAYQPRTGPVTYATGTAAPINWQQYSTPPPAAAPPIPIGIAVHHDPGVSIIPSAAGPAATAGMTIPSWFTDTTQSLIPNVPNWAILAGAAAALFLFTGRR